VAPLLGLFQRLFSIYAGGPLAETVSCEEWRKGLVEYPELDDLLKRSLQSTQDSTAESSVRPKDAASNALCQSQLKYNGGADEPFGPRI
jgi:hypothetical protein